MAHLTYPFTITPNTLASASQVMGNFDAIKNILNGGIDGTNLADGAVTSGKLASKAVDTSALADGAVTSAKLAADAVNTTQLVDEAVTNAKMAADAVDTPQLVDDAVTGDKLAEDSVDSQHYVDGSIDTAHLADAAVTPGKTNFFNAVKVWAGWVAWDDFNGFMTGIGFSATRVSTGRYRISASGVSAGVGQSLVLVAMARASGGTYHTCHVVGSSSTYVEVQVRTEAGVAADATVEGVLLLVG